MNRMRLSLNNIDHQKRSLFKKRRRMDDDDDDDENDITEVITLDPDSESEEIDKPKPFTLKKSAPNETIIFNVSVPSTSRAGATASPASYSNSHAQSKHSKNYADDKILPAIAMFMIEDLHPASLIRESGFIKLMTTLRPDYKLPTFDDISNNIHLMYGIEKANLMDLLETVNAISIAIERWTSNAENSYATIKANFIDDEWEQKSYVLSTTQLNDPFSVKLLSDQIIQMAHRWEIQDKIVSVIYDWLPENGSTSATLPSSSAPSSLDPYQCLGTKMSCFAIKLQAAIDISLNRVDEIQVLIDKCKRIVSHFHHDTVADIYLAKYQKYLEVPRDQLIQASRDEINSTYLMLDRLMSQRLAIDSVFGDRDVVDEMVANELQMSNADWSIIEKTVAALKPFQLAKVVLYRGKHRADSVSVVKPLIDSFCKNFLMFEVSEDTSTIFSLKKCIREELLSKFPMYVANEEITRPDHYDIATYLDPRYKNQEYLNDHNRETIRNFVLEEFFTKNKTSPRKPSTTSALFNHSAKALSILFPPKRNELIANEWTRYNNEPEIDKSLSMYKWWKLNESVYPVLSTVAKRHLCTSAISKSINTSQHIAYRRKQLPPQDIDKLIFLNHKLNFDDT